MENLASEKNQGFNPFIKWKCLNYHLLSNIWVYESPAIHLYDTILPNVSLLQALFSKNIASLLFIALFCN